MINELLTTKIVKENLCVEHEINLIPNANKP